MKNMRSVLLIAFAIPMLAAPGIVFVSEAYAARRHFIDVSNTDAYLVPGKLKRRALICLVGSSRRLRVRRVVRTTKKRIYWKKIGGAAAKTPKSKSRLRKTSPISTWAIR